MKSPFSEQGIDAAVFAWSEHRVGGRVCTRLDLKLAQCFDPLKLLAPSRSWAFVWKGRDEDTLTLALDALDSTRDLTSIESSLPWYGGRAFFDENSDTKSWGELGNEFWFFPAEVWTLTAEYSRLSLHAFGEGAEVRAALLRRCEDVLALHDSRPRPVLRKARLLQRVDQPSREEWRKTLRAAQGTEMQKVVLSRSTTLRLDEETSWLLWLSHLLVYREESYVFAIKSPDGRCFLGRSPERILAWNEGRFQVDAIAGTRRRGASAIQDRVVAQELLHSEKEQSEHRYVSRFVARVLGELHLPFQQIDDEKLLTLTHLQHMRSRFQGFFQGHCTAVDLLQKLHPTPAVGGEPTAGALRFLREHEGYERGWYAGYIGWASADGGECAIGIRSALIHGHSLTLFAGAGIVADSDPDAEWDETELKMQTFLSLLETYATRSPRQQQAES